MLRCYLGGANGKIERWITVGYIELVKECLGDTCLTDPVVNIMVENSSFAELHKEDPEFVGHYPPEYWAEYVLNEYKEMLKRCLIANEIHTT